MLRAINSNITYISIIFILLLVISGCSSNNHRDNLIYKLESEIILPPKAQIISSYSRFYFIDKDKTITSVYMIQNVKDKEFIKQECTKLKIKGYPCDDKKYGIIEPNKIRYVDNVDYLPFQSGGGCDYIFIKYNIATSNFSQIECNGSY